MNDLIHTKLIVEVYPAKFLSLGFGNIAQSQADVVCISSFRKTGFTTNSAIGAISRALGPGVLRRQLDVAEQTNEPCSLVDLRDLRTPFKQLLVVWMGTVKQFLQHDNAEEFVRFGLLGALSKLRTFETPTQIDITALGSQYGGLNRRHVFDLLVSWAAELFNQCPTVNHLRLVSYDLDTFVDFYEALHRLKNMKGKEIGLVCALDYGTYGTFSQEITSAAQLLDQNPKQVLVICRMIVEQVIYRLCEERLPERHPKLVENIKALYDHKHLPPQINSFLHTCRVVGNFAVHPSSNGEQFNPSRRDAEAVMLLTLRIVEWFLGGAKGDSAH